MVNARRLPRDRGDEVLQRVRQVPQCQSPARGTSADPGVGQVVVSGRHVRPASDRSHRGRSRTGTPPRSHEVRCLAASDRSGGQQIRSRAPQSRPADAAPLADRRHLLTDERPAPGTDHDEGQAHQSEGGERQPGTPSPTTETIKRAERRSWVHLLRMASGRRSYPVGRRPRRRGRPRRRRSTSSHPACQLETPSRSTRSARRRRATALEGMQTVCVRRSVRVRAQSARGELVSRGSSLISRCPGRRDRPAIAVTSIGSTRSSATVPTWPGRTSSTTRNSV